MRLLLDEDARAKALIRLLLKAGHDVVTTSDLGLDGQPDPAVLQAATSAGRVLLTFNCDDFRELHNRNSGHFGIVAVYQDAEPSKRLTYEGIARALANLEVSGHRIASNFHVLNAWSY